MFGGSWSSSSHSPELSWSNEGAKVCKQPPSKARQRVDGIQNRDLDETMEGEGPKSRRRTRRSGARRCGVGKERGEVAWETDEGGWTPVANEPTSRVHQRSYFPFAPPTYVRREPLSLQRFHYALCVCHDAQHELCRLSQGLAAEEGISPGLR